MDTALQLIVGLGNPGLEYENTRHNAGADFVYQLARTYGALLSPEKKFFGLTGRTRIDNHDVRLLIPTTFMNRSGQSVSAMAQFYKIPPEAILIVHDELSLPLGVARFKLGGGHGGNNGVRDIIQALGNNNNFARLRLGIDHPGSANRVTGYLLNKTPQSDRLQIEETINIAMAEIPSVVKGEWNTAMKRLHTKKEN